jgi:DNA-binding MarR family transcriptional regulator
MNAKNIIELVSRYEEFAAGKKNEDLREFSVWLAGKLEKADDRRQEAASPEDVDRQIAYLLNRVAKYSRFYTRKMLAGFNITSIDEFYFLNAIAKLKNPSKSEVYFDTITELTTGAQIMKRLIALGFVREVPDGKDKRMRRVTLTKKGESLRQAVYRGLGATVKLKAGNMPLAEKKNFLAALTYIESFHDKVYRTDPDKSIDAIIHKYILCK